MLVWLPTGRREVTVRRQLHRIWRDLDQPHLIPVATAAADHLNPDTSHPSPAEPIWAPLTATGGDARYPLHDLAGVWSLPAPCTVNNPAAGVTPKGVLPPPEPMPPAPGPRLVSR